MSQCSVHLYNYADRLYSYAICSTPIVADLQPVRLFAKLYVCDNHFLSFVFRVKPGILKDFLKGLGKTDWRVFRVIDHTGATCFSTCRSRGVNEKMETGNTATPYFLSAINKSRTKIAKLANLVN